MSMAQESVMNYGAAWILMVLCLGGLVLFDFRFLQKQQGERIQFQRAVKLTLFWIVTGAVFDVLVACSLGWTRAVGYFEGYMLEYMLSFDNLFAFRMVFSYYCTPEALLYRAVTYGITGAIVLRVVVYATGYFFLSVGHYIVKLILGCILIWSGIKTINELDDEEDDSPTNNRFINFVTRVFPISDKYDPDGNLFMTVVEVHATPPRTASCDTDAGLSDAVLGMEAFEASSSGLPRLESFEGSSLLHTQRIDAMSSATSKNSALNSDTEVKTPARPRRKASLMFLVVIAICFVDLVFAVDSVASKMALIDDIFLNCSSSAFAMFGLRSLYFVMEALVHAFESLKYGIGAILVLLGMNLVFSKWINLSNGVLFALIVAICFASIASSYWMPRVRESCERLEMSNLGAIAEANESDEDDRWQH